MGTPARELQMYDEQKSDTDGVDTKSAHMVFHPYLTEENNIFYVDMNLGNNGLLEVTPAQGLKLSKTVDIVEPNTSTDFSFRITVHNANGTPFTGKLDGWTTALDVVPLGEPTEISFSSIGTYTINLSNDQTFWLTGVPAGTTYTIEEISSNADYKVKSVHVNGASAGEMASGTIAAYFIDEVDFVNTAIGEGDLVITKRVVDESGNAVDVKDDIKFTAEVTLKDRYNNPLHGRFEASTSTGYIDVPTSGTFTITLSEGESVVIRNIPEETRYSVVEPQSSIPKGFQFNADRSSMAGVIDATSNDQALIVNTYVPVGTDGQNININVLKIITGNRTNWLDGESYTFEVKCDNAVVAQFTIDNNDADKKQLLNLSGEDYLAAGTYHYTITELQGTVGGVTYDTAERSFDVAVADSDMDGVLEVVAVNYGANTTVAYIDGVYTVNATFNNIYQPTGSSRVEVDIIKKMQGNYRLNGFQFALYDKNPFASAEAEEILRSTVTDASGFAKITLSYAANLATIDGTTFTYYLAEINTGNPNITYSEAVYKVEVTLKDNGDGTTSASPVITEVSGGEFENNNPVFTNIFTPSEEAYVTLTANKSIVGDRVLNANEFSFVIEALTNNAPMPLNTTATNAENGAVVFDAIKFDAAGTYKYKIYESDANAIGGFDYDSRFYEVTVQVTDSAAKLYASVTVVEKEDQNDLGRTLAANEIMTFSNVYSATPVGVKLNGHKILTGKTLQDNEFEFVITPTGNTVLPAGYDNTVKNVGNTFNFEELVFDKAGVYTYNITEQSFASENYDFDSSVYAVTITVTDNSEGILSAKVQILKNGAESSEIVFRNSFVPTPITFDISTEFGGTKILDGRPVKDGEFEFALINAMDGKQIGDTVRNFNDGNSHIFKFPKVTIPEAGKYHYKIIELIGDEKGVSYDTASYHVVLDVIQDDSGILHIKDDATTVDIVEGQQLYKGTVTKEEVGGVLTEVVHYENISQNGKIVFNNSYKADPVYVTLQATKILTGRDLKDGEFKFDLYETDGTYAYNGKTPVQDNVVLTLNEFGTGNITFMPITFENEGTFHYVVVEDELDEKGITADKTAYKVEVAVTDNHNGNLVATIKVNGQNITDSTADIIKFHNTYSVAATEVVIKGNKILTGRELEAEEFSFELYDNDNVIIETVKNSADGAFEFTPIPITEAGEYLYTVREVTGSEEEITYDDTVYTVKVEVVDNLDGTFKVKYTYLVGTEITDGLIFTNVYNAPAPELEPELEDNSKSDSKDESENDLKSPQTGENRNMWMWFALVFVSGTGVFGTALCGKKKKEAQKES